MKKHEHIMVLDADQSDTGKAGVRMVCEWCGGKSVTYDPEQHELLEKSPSAKEEMSDDAIKKILEKVYLGGVESITKALAEEATMDESLETLSIKQAAQQIRQYIEKEIRDAFDIAWLASGADTKNLKLAKEMYIEKLREPME
jgi:hypothetical protein